MIDLKVGLFLINDDLKVEFEVLFFVGLLEVADDLVGRDEVEVDPAEEAHSDLGSLF